MGTRKIKRIQVASSAGKDEPSRIVEDRGQLAILHPRGPVYNPCYFDIQPGKDHFRGEHYHKSKTELFYIISGSCLLKYIDLDTKEAGDLRLKTGAMVQIMPMCAHRMEAEEFSQVVEFSLSDVDYASDTFSYLFI